MFDHASLEAIHLPMLLARNEMLRSLSSGFRESGAEVNSSGLMIGLALLVAAMLGCWMLARSRAQKEQQRPYMSPRRLLKELCRAHGLDWKNRQLVARLARLHRLDQPALLFIDERYFELTGQKAVALQSKQAELRQLRERLFASGEETTGE